MINQIIENIEQNPRILFLIDGFGAMLSAFLLGVVLVNFERIFGIPSSTLYFLATLPIFFAIYDFYFYFYRKVNYKIGLFLKGIATLNLFYCCLSLGFAFYHFRTISILGWSYILIEIFILIVLIKFELKVANRLIKNEKNNG